MKYLIMEVGANGQSTPIPKLTLYKPILIVRFVIESFEYSYEKWGTYNVLLIYSTFFVLKLTSIFILFFIIIRLEIEKLKSLASLNFSFISPSHVVLYQSANILKLPILMQLFACYYILSFLFSGHHICADGESKKS